MSPELRHQGCPGPSSAAMCGQRYLSSTVSGFLLPSNLAAVFLRSKGVGGEGGGRGDWDGEHM